MSQLHELLAVEGDLNNTVKAVLEETQKTFSSKHEHFKGQVRTCTYYDEDRQQENEMDEKPIVDTVREKLGYTVAPIARLYDALLQKESANQRAVADLVVDGTTIGTNLPATFLLGLESRLKMVQHVLLAVPTLDPGLVWDTDSLSDIHTANDVISKRTEKVPMHKVLTPATKEHPAQIREWMDTSNVADIVTRNKSAMVSPQDKSDLLRRMDKLISAVKKARQKANTVEVDDLRVGEELFKYLLG